MVAVDNRRYLKSPEDDPPKTDSYGKDKYFRVRAVMRGHKMQNGEVEEVWNDYRDARAKKDTLEKDRARNKLIVNYSDIVAFIAERMNYRLPREVDVNDLYQAGIFGLVDAIDAFDQERGVKFGTYCSQRIRGSMFDHLRKMDQVPRLVRNRTAKIERLRNDLFSKLGRQPTNLEIQKETGLDDSEFKIIFRDSSVVETHSLQKKWFETDTKKDVEDVELIPNNREENPLLAQERKDLRNLTTKDLSRREKLIMDLYYYENMTMKEIGKVIDLTESRIGQMHSSIIDKLRDQLEGREDEFFFDRRYVA